MPSIENLTIKNRMVDNNKLSNKVKYPSRLIDKKNSVILVKSLNTKDKIQFQIYI